MARNNNRFSLFRNNNNKNKEEIQVSPQDREELEGLKSDIQEIQQKTTFLVHGADQSFEDRNKNDLKQIKDTINAVSDKYKSVTGDSMIEFLTRMVMDEKKGTRSSNINPNSPTFEKEKQKGLMELSKMLENPNNGIISDLYMKEKMRIDLYTEYDLIVEYIPQLYQALNVYVDNIISPDDFTKDIFNIFYNDKDINGNEAEVNSILNNLKEINRKYKFEDRTRKLVSDTLKYGDQFVACLPYDEEFNKIFAESADFHDIINEDIGTELSESTLLLTEEERNQFNEFLKEDNYEGNLAEDIANMINNNIVFTENKYAIMDEEVLLEAEFKMETLFTDSKLKDVRTKDMEDPKPSLNKPTKKSIKTRGKNSKKSVMFNDNPLFQNVDELSYTRSSDKVDTHIPTINTTNLNKNMKTYINGSYVRILDPRRVIKIWLNGHCYGYYYIETETNNMNNMMAYQNPLSRTSTFQLRNAVDLGISSTNDNNRDPKSQLILDVFLKNISKKLNKKFIANNDEFKEILYTLLKEEYITKKRISIIYLSPDDVEHLYVNLQTEKGKPGEGYGESIFKKILFTAKIYLAVLTCTLMMKLSRSADHRAFYVETGLSNDIEGVIQSFVREIKSKEIKISDMGSIDTILNSVGMFHDYYIPQINGEKTIDIDTVPGQQADMDNDFLEYLRKAMISGLGIPASFLSYADEMEFARSVSQMNAMFLRTIVTYQKYLGYGFSAIFRKLYKNEFGKKEDEKARNSDEDEKVCIVDYEQIEIRFPSPATLNMTNLAEQIATVSQVSEFIVQTLLGMEGESNPQKKDNLSRQVVKDLMQNIDWDKYEEMRVSTPIKEIEDQLKNPQDPNMMMNPMGMDDQMMDDGMGMGSPMGTQPGMNQQSPLGQQDLFGSSTNNSMSGMGTGSDLTKPTSSPYNPKF